MSVHKKNIIVVLFMIMILVAAALVTGCGSSSTSSDQGTTQKSVNEANYKGGSVETQPADLKVDYVTVQVSDHTAVVGEVLNNGDKTSTKIAVSVKAYDKTGKIIDTQSGALPLEWLKPQEKSSFSTDVKGVIDRLDVTVTGVTTDQTPYRDFTEVSGTYTPPTGRYSTMGNYVGEVTNTGSAPATYVKIVLTGYGADGKLVWSGWTYAEPHDLAAGQSGSFKEYASYNAALIATIKVQFTCNEAAQS